MCPSFWFVLYFSHNQTGVIFVRSEATWVICHYHDIVSYQGYVLSIRFVIIDADFDGLARGHLSGLHTLKFSTSYPCCSLCKEITI